jgi:hypothetical protein
MKFKFQCALCGKAFNVDTGANPMRCPGCDLPIPQNMVDAAMRQAAALPKPNAAPNPALRQPKRTEPAQPTYWEWVVTPGAVVCNIHPAYAGTYAYGRTESTNSYTDGESRRGHRRNGHDFVAQQLKKKGIAMEQVDNAFVHLDDPAAAQRIADRFAELPWPKILERYARQINPLQHQELK